MTDRIRMVDRERVFCANRQADIDVERCLACPDLKELRVDKDTEIVICTAVPRRKRELEALLL